MRTSIVIIFLLAFQLVKSQSIVGLWEINKVKVGDEDMTPVAKWNRFNADGTLEAGNGWLQNSEGTWTFDVESNLLQPENKYGFPDPYGPFKVAMEGENMRWEREEDGMQVNVFLSRINKIPKSPADWLTGIWGLKQKDAPNEDVPKKMHLEEQYYYLIRWDRIYVRRYHDGTRKTGYWHINGHRSEVTFLSHSKEDPVESWTIEVDEASLTMTGISDSNKDKVLAFERLKDFPD